MKKIGILALVGLLILPIAVAASPQREAERSEATAQQHEEGPLPTVFRWANLIVLVGGLGYLLRKPFQQFFEDRRQQIVSGLERAQQAQTSARKRMDEIEQRLATLSAEVAALRSEAERESQLERQKILGEAKSEIDRTVEQSRQEIERVARSVERTIKESIADSIVDRAANTLRTEMTEDDQKRVVVRFIKQL